MIKESEEWEQLFKKVMVKARKCPALALVSNNTIDAIVVSDAAGNHVFDDYFEFWGITQQEGHQLSWNLQ